MSLVDLLVLRVEMVWLSASRPIDCCVLRVDMVLSSASRPTDCWVRRVDRVLSSASRPIDLLVRRVPAARRDVSTGHARDGQTALLFVACVGERGPRAVPELRIVSVS